MTATRILLCKSGYFIRVELESAGDLLLGFVALLDWVGKLSDKHGLGDLFQIAGDVVSRLRHSDVEFTAMTNALLPYSWREQCRYYLTTET